MYDNLDLRLSKDECEGIDLLEEVPQFLTCVKVQGLNNSGPFIVGYLDRLRITITDNNVKINQSSLCKYYHGNNFKTLTREDTEMAIKQISEALHLPFDHAIVTRIDFAENMSMENDEKLYYPYLGVSQYYDRLEQNNGLYFVNNKRQLIFYGKVNEQKDKKNPIPDEYKNHNLLRFEMRLLKNPSKQLNQPQITAGMLYDKKFYHELVLRWYNEYRAIQKISTRLTNLKPTGSTKSLIESLATFSILDIGQPAVLATIKEWSKTSQITRKQASDHRAIIKKLASNQPEMKNNELVQELDHKVRDAMKFHLSESLTVSLN